MLQTINYSMDEQNSQVPAPQITPTQKHYPAKKVWTITGIVAVVVLIGGVLGYLEIRNKYLILPVPPLPGSNINSQNANSSSWPETSDMSGTPTTPDTSYLDAYGSQECKDRGEIVTSRSKMVEWIEPKKNENFKIFAKLDQVSGVYTAQYYDVNYVVGHIKEGKYAGGDFIVSQITPDGPSVGERYRIISKDGKYYYLSKYSNALPDKPDSNIFLTKLVVDNDFELPDLEFPEQLILSNPDAKFSYVKSMGFFQNGVDFFCKDNLVKVFTDEKVGDVYTDTLIEEDLEGVYSYGKRHGFYVKGPDSSLRTYQLDIPFVDQKVPYVTWSDSKVNSQEYMYQAIGGCGSNNFRDVAKVKFEDLKQIGVTSIGGQPVYGYKNSDSPELTYIYETMYVPEGESKISYQNFIASRPIFFWKDQFGKFIRFKSTKYQPMAECGKPVIYLYPETTQKISVKVSPVGGFTFTEPAYNQGWNVISDPVSNITNLADGKVYPYLFWEGRGGMYQTPDRGFVVAQADAHNFLLEKLAKLGLNTKESADFMEYWEPKMQGSPYYFVTFMGNSTMDALAPLEVSPKPDTVIRILMDFVPLEKPIAVQGFNIRTPERKGFTVVEWGGVRRN